MPADWRSAPTLDRALLIQGAGVTPARRDMPESTGRRGGLAFGISAPTPNRTGLPENAAGVLVAHADRPEGPVMLGRWLPKGFSPTDALTIISHRTRAIATGADLGEDPFRSIDPTVGIQAPAPHRAIDVECTRVEQSGANLKIVTRRWIGLTEPVGAPAEELASKVDAARVITADRNLSEGHLWRIALPEMAPTPAGDMTIFQASTGMMPTGRGLCIGTSVPSRWLGSTKIIGADADEGPSISDGTGLTPTGLDAAPMRAVGAIEGGTDLRNLLLTAQRLGRGRPHTGLCEHRRHQSLYQVIHQTRVCPIRPIALKR